eukprot:scaffold11740_cov53-Phaeocystis_antarctica.AAC.1
MVGAGPKSCHRGAILAGRGRTGDLARGGSPKSPPNTSSSHLSPGKRCGATAQSALGWYRPSVKVPETLDVQRRPQPRIKYDPPASPDRAYNARVLSTARLEENRRKI